MKYTDEIVENFLNSKERELKFVCAGCNKNSIRNRRSIVKALRARKSKDVTCSLKCARLMGPLGKNFVEMNCPVCTKKFRRTFSDIKKSKSKKCFCGSSCAAHHNNLQRPVGLRRSALEIWIEKKLTEAYPKLQIDFNKKDAIGSELDIYVPSLKIAFELNGFFHYYRIMKNKYGSIILKRTKKNDARKLEACKKAGIDLIVINTSRMRNFAFSRSNKYLFTITKKINKSLKVQK